MRNLKSTANIHSCMKALIMNILYVSTNNMNEVYSTKDRSTLIIANSDTTHALVLKQNRVQKTIEVYSATESQKELLFSLYPLSPTNFPNNCSTKVLFFRGSRSSTLPGVTIKLNNSPISLQIR